MNPLNYVSCSKLRNLLFVLVLIISILGNMECKQRVSLELCSLACYRALSHFPLFVHLHHI